MTPIISDVPREMLKRIRGDAALFVATKGRGKDAAKGDPAVKPPG